MEAFGPKPRIHALTMVGRQRQTSYSAGGFAPRGFIAPVT